MFLNQAVRKIAFIRTKTTPKGKRPCIQWIAGTKLCEKVRKYHWVIRRKRRKQKLHWYAKRGILNKVCEARKRHVQIKGHAAFFVLFYHLPYKICKMDFLSILHRPTGLSCQAAPGLPYKLGRMISAYAC